MMYHYPDLGSASDWSWHTEASDVILRETSVDVTKCQLFSFLFFCHYHICLFMFKLFSLFDPDHSQHYKK